MATLHSCELGDKQLPSIRNIGIVAHIDAGKTTTTERMLFYAGKVKKIGEVDVGTTTTDYMEEEMARGITITSAAVTFEWKGHTVNLIDTPGHADFTVEVERALRVVDGVVALFDASAGVQAQSYTVLRQARKFETPLIAFINKMDKSNANFDKSVKSIRDKLGVIPVLTQFPLAAVDGDFEGVVDLVALTTIRFSGPNGSEMSVAQLSLTGNEYLWQLAESRRKELVETVANRDDPLSEKYLHALEENDGDEVAASMSIKAVDLRAAIRRLTISTAGSADPVVPVLCGAARRDQGVQPLLDAVAAYLPSPTDRLNLVGFNAKNVMTPLPKPSNMPTSQTIALVFKIIHTIYNGKWASLCFFRVYAGRVYPKQDMTGYGSGDKEYLVSMEKVFTMHANNPLEVPFVGAGSIGAAYLEQPFTGDTLVRMGLQQRRSLSTSTVTSLAASAKRPAEGDDADRPEDLVIKRLEGISPPPAAVSFCLEAPAERLLGSLERALKCLCREDPSLHEGTNEHRQIILSGMGELHLEIVLSRLNREYQVPCKLLRAMVEYREGFAVDFTTGDLEGRINDIPIVSASFSVKAVLAATSGEGETVQPEEAPMTVLVSSECEAAVSSQAGMTDAQRKGEVEELREFGKILKKNLPLCSKCGPLAGLPLIGAAIELESFKKLACSTDPFALDSAARQMLHEVIYSCRTSKLVLLEPMMKMNVVLTEVEYFGDVITCLNTKGAVTIETADDCKEIMAVVPMRNLVRFGAELRKVARGNAYFWMAVDHYRVVSDEKVRNAILRNRGITE
jgi:elongation factor G